jgi:hypothetical protein
MDRGTVKEVGATAPMKIRNIRMTDEEWSAAKFVGTREIRRYVLARAEQMKKEMIQTIKRVAKESK